MRGQVPRSSDLTSAVQLMTATSAIWFSAPTIATAIVRLLRRSITMVPRAELTVRAAVELIQSAAGVVATIAIPILLVVMASGFVANLMQTGWLWIPSAVVPRFRGLRLFSEDSGAKGAAALLRLTVLLFVASRFVLTHDWKLRSVGSNEPMAMLAQPALMLGELAIQLSLTLVLIALADYGFRFWRNEQRLKMTVEERRQEQRDEAGDPNVRKRRADIGRRETSEMPLSQAGRIEPTSR